MRSRPTARSAVRHAMAAVVPVVTVTGALLGHPAGPLAPGTAGLKRTRCSRACGGRCRSAVRSRPALL